jgi:hypothetical protein
MRIAILVEGKTEKAFIPHLRRYLARHLQDRMPNLDLLPYNGLIPTENKLARCVEHLLTGQRAADYVIALTDVYTGTTPPVFLDATDAKQKMHDWVGPEPRFYAHAAQHDFEAWLLPYWPTIQKLAGHNRRCPAGHPEAVNHGNPPAHRIQDLFEAGSNGRSYVKPRDGARILSDNDLATAIAKCSELKALVNTILTLSGVNPLP